MNNPLRFAKFQELIAVQTGVSAAQQKLMFKYEEFRPDPMAPASLYPNTSVSGESQRERKTSFLKLLSYSIGNCYYDFDKHHHFS